MKYISSLSVAISICLLSFASNESGILAKILKAQKKYYKEHIIQSKEGYDSAYYKSILGVAIKNRALVLTKIREIDSAFYLDRLSKFYILEGWNGAHGYMHGIIWNDSSAYEYSWGDNGVKVSKMEFGKKTEIMRDVEKWDSTLKSRSLCCSNVTDGFHFLCSRALKGVSGWDIETTAFYDYR